MLERLRDRSRWLVPALAVLLALELTPSLPAQTWDASTPPASDVWLAHHPGGIAAIYPLVGDQQAAADLNGEEYYFQRFHGHPLFSAIAASSPRLVIALRSVAQYFSSPNTDLVLTAEHVKYVVVRDDVYRKMKQKPPSLPPSEYTFLARVKNARIYRVRPRKVSLSRFIARHPALLATGAGLRVPADQFGDGFYAPEKYSFYATPWRWVSQDAKLTITPSSDIQTVTFSALAFSNAGPRKLTVYGPHGHVVGTALVQTFMQPIKFGPFAVHGGSSQTFTLHLDPGPASLGGTDTRLGSIYLNEPVFQPLLTTR